MSAGCYRSIPLVVVQTARARSVDSEAWIAPPTVVAESSHTLNTSRRRPTPFLVNDDPTLLPTEVAFLLATVARMGRALRFKFLFYLLSHGLRAGFREIGQNGAAHLNQQIRLQSSSILRWQEWWTVPRQTASPHVVIRSLEARAFFIRLV